MLKMILPIITLKFILIYSVNGESGENDQRFRQRGQINPSPSASNYNARYLNKLARLKGRARLSDKLPNVQNQHFNGQIEEQQQKKRQRESEDVAPIYNAHQFSELQQKGIAHIFDHHQNDQNRHFPGQENKKLRLKDPSEMVYLQQRLKPIEGLAKKDHTDLEGKQRKLENEFGNLIQNGPQNPIVIDSEEDQQQQQQQKQPELAQFQSIDEFKKWLLSSEENDEKQLPQGHSRSNNQLRQNNEGKGHLQQESEKNNPSATNIPIHHFAQPEPHPATFANFPLNSFGQNTNENQLQNVKTFLHQQLPQIQEQKTLNSLIQLQKMHQLQERIASRIDQNGQGTNWHQPQKYFVGDSFNHHPNTNIPQQPQQQFPQQNQIILDSFTREQLKEKINKLIKLHIALKKLNEGMKTAKDIEEMKKIENEIKKLDPEEKLYNAISRMNDLPVKIV